MPREAKKSKALRSWRITEIRRRGQPFGIVKATDAAAAIAVAIEAFGTTDPHRQKRLAAQPTE